MLFDPAQALHTLTPTCNHQHNSYQHALDSLRLFRYCDAKSSLKSKLTTMSIPFVTIFILALVQGITEFLPVSSSGHLVLVHATLNTDLKTQDWAHALTLDVAVHVGTLFSVLVYFYKDLFQMMAGIKNILRGDIKSDGAQININIVVSSIPVIIAGLIIHAMELSWIRSIEIVAWMTLIFGIILWIADRYQPSERMIKDMGSRDAILIGLAQALALIPGTSRSGVTMIAGRLLGYSRTEAAQYSLLLAIIAIGGAGTLAAIDLLQSGTAQFSIYVLLAVVISFLAGWLSIGFMMKWLEKFSFAPFAIYRVVVGVILLGAIYSGLIS